MVVVISIYIFTALNKSFFVRRSKIAPGQRRSQWPDLMRHGLECCLGCLESQELFFDNNSIQKPPYHREIIKVPTDFISFN